MKVLGSVSRIVHTAPKGGAIFRLIRVGNHESLRVVANYQVMPSPPALGEYLELTGEFRTDVNFGKQFYAATAVRRVPDDKAIVDLIGRHSAFSGMGRNLARRLWEKLGTSLGQVLDAGHVPDLVIAGLPDTLALQLVQDWQRFSLETKVLEFFQRYMLPMDAARTAIHFWGRRTIEFVKENPYRLTPFAQWQKVDRSALLGLKIPFDSEIRLVAACEAVCNDKLNRYQFAVEMKEFALRLAEKLGDTTLSKKAIDAAVSSGAIVVRAGGKLEIVQGRGAYLIEQGLQALIHGEALNSRDKEQLYLHLGHKVLSLQQEFPKLCIVPLSNWASQSFWKACASLLPGALHIVPTESSIEALFLPEKAESVLLGDVVSGRRLVHAKDRPIFIHEAASLDILVSNILLRSLFGASSIYLVGDASQPLPSGPGIFFHSLAESTSIMHVDVGERHCPNNSPARKIAASLCTETTTKVAAEEDQTPDIISVSVTSTHDRHAATLAAYREEIESGSAVIIGKTWRACRIVNEELHKELVDYLNVTGGTLASIKLRWNEGAVVGDVITCHNNEYRRGLMVGSRGVVVDIFATPQQRTAEDGSRIAVIASANIDTVGLIELTADDCRWFSLGYAIPVSYALLSRWETVIACIEMSRLIDKNWIYAASSRAIKCVIVIGQREDIESVLQRSRPAASRLTGLFFDVPNTRRKLKDTP